MSAVMEGLHWSDRTTSNDLYKIWFLLTQNWESSQKDKESYTCGTEVFNSQLVVCQPVQMLGYVL